MPRYIGSDSVVRPYDHREARGWNWLKNVDRGAYSKEEYRGHLGEYENDLIVSFKKELQTEDLVAILTDDRVLLIRSRKLRVEWELGFDGKFDML